MLHYYVLFWSKDSTTFLSMYAKIAKDSMSLFYMLTFLCIVFGMHLALHYIQKYRLAASNVEHEEAGAYIIHAVLYTGCVISSLRFNS